MALINNTQQLFRVNPNYIMEVNTVPGLKTDYPNNNYFKMQMPAYNQGGLNADLQGSIMQLSQNLVDLYNWKEGSIHQADEENKKTKKKSKKKKDDEEKKVNEKKDKEQKVRAEKLEKKVKELNEERKKLKDGYKKE